MNQRLLAFASTLTILSAAAAWTACTSNEVSEIEAPGAGGEIPEDLPNQFCINGPTGELCSKIPHDVTEVLGFGYDSLGPRTQRPFDVFGWQMFVALNWPADASGTPSPGTIGSAPGAPRVWEFYETPSQVFGLTPQNPVMVTAQERGKRVFRLMAKSDHEVKTGAFLEATGQPLVDRNLNFIVYDIVMNPVEVEYIRANGLDTKAGQEAFKAEHKEVSFPLGSYANNDSRTGGGVGAIEIKTAWRILDPAWGDDPSRFYTVDGVVYVAAEDSESGQAFHFDATLGLVGFHVIQRTTGPLTATGTPFDQDWMWTTFEHVDNSPLAANAREPDDINPPLPTTAEPPESVSKIYSFYDPDYDGPTNVPPTGPYKWATSPPYAKAYANEGKYGTQVVRGWKVYPPTQELNDLWQEKLAGTVWANYFQVGTQWQGGSDSPDGPGNGNIPRYLSNTTLETYIQFESYGSCLDCHSHAQTKAGQDANFSYLLDLAR